ncbi:GatB/YqeY domain-containing protein [Candidatus Dojkabacteria bacterium]|uniref:GatB/YqeY domain-containing protein n=1 Tax=Candidatus Dojkabacteria bacterium TaxID=2099670 RepID=A0A847CZH7_9BACT|nr:GatB/YqeY domain-containing protein [Candidatus Dojkabacteria bacterium]
MSLIDTFRKDMISATKDGNTDKLDILKLALASMINAQKAASEELKDVDFEKILKKEVKKVKDSIVQFSAIGRMELANREKRQLEVLESYLPKEMSSEDVAKIVKRIISAIKPEGSKDMGRVMGVVMKEVAGRADGNIVKEIVLEHLK